MVAIAACSGAYGHIRYNREVDLRFQQFEMVDTYTYYFSGRRNLPSAIVGIDPSFEIQSRFWTVIEPHEFKTMVRRLSPPTYGLLSGADLIAPDGRRAGVWYSWVNTVSIRFDGNRITISFPDPSIRRVG